MLSSKNDRVYLLPTKSS